jgi:thymidylate kinase
MKIELSAIQLENALKKVRDSILHKYAFDVDDVDLPDLVKRHIIMAYEYLKSDIKFERRGKFIVITGIDKSGKETYAFNPQKFNIISIKEFMERKGFEVLKIKQPSYNTVIGGLVGAYLGRNSKFTINGKLSKDVAWILWSLDRAQHNRAVADWLSRGERYVVLSKRWTESNVIYQFLNGIQIEDILRLEENIIRPDYFIILDIPLNKLIERLNKSRTDVYEKIEFLRKVKKCYLKMSKYYPYGDVYIVDAGRGLKETNKNLLETVEHIILSWN